MDKFNRLIRRVATIPVPLIALLVSAAAFLLRIYHAGHINNDIMDLHARQAIMTIDILRGHFHFPNAPWVFEYDESGLAWLMSPVIWIFGHKWIVFRTLGAVVTSIVPGVVTFVVTRHWNRRTGIAAGILFASLPAQMVWDRNLVMSALSVTTITWFTAMHWVTWRNGERYWKFPLAGMLIGASCYVVHYNTLILPTLLLIILSDSLYRGHFLKRSIVGGVSVLVGWLVTTIPLLMHKMKNPEYLDWRKRHLLEFNGDVMEYASLYAKNMSLQFNELFVGGGRFLFLHDGLSVLSPIMGILVLAGTIYLCHRQRHKICFVLSLPIILYLMMGTTKPEDWRGVFDIHYIPFLVILGALGIRQLGIWLRRLVPISYVRLVMAVFLLVIVMYHSHLFFKGRYMIHPRPDFLTRLQKDMMELPADRPYLFSDRIQEVVHYHLPFWFVTRVDHFQVSIFGWNGDGWYTEPDVVPIEFVQNSDAEVAFVIRKENKNAFIEQMGQERIVGWSALAHADLLVASCQVDVPEILKRTWTESLVIPILDVNPKKR